MASRRSRAGRRTGRTWIVCLGISLVCACFAGSCDDDTAGGAADGNTNGASDTAVPGSDDGSADTAGSGGDVERGDATDGGGTSDGEDSPDGEDSDATSGQSVYRFIAMGDTGEGNQEQKTVGAGAQKRCDELGGCHGFIMLGDNIYDDGPESAMDSEFTTKIDKPYRQLKYGPPPPSGQSDNRKRMPIYVSLGNHDLGGAGLESQLIQHFLDYAKQHSWFYYPSEYWEKQIGFVHLVSIHTNPLAYKGTKTEPQGDLVDRVVQNTSANWTIVFGHHEYRSNGDHGNAGEYEGIPGDLTPLGGDYREWVNDHVCDDVDFLLTGHDHNRQWINKMPELTSDGDGAENDICDTHLALSGAGAKTRDMVDRGNDLAFGEPTLGFLLLEFHRNKVKAEFCDKNGVPEWSKTITKSNP